MGGAGGRSAAGLEPWPRWAPSARLWGGRGGGCLRRGGGVDGAPQLSRGSRSQRAWDAGSGQPWGFTHHHSPGTPGALLFRPWLCPLCPCGVSEPEALSSHVDRVAAPPPPPRSRAPTVGGEQSRAPLLSVGRFAEGPRPRPADAPGGRHGSGLGCPSTGRRSTRGSSCPRSPDVSLPQRIRRRRPGVPPKCTCECPAGRESTDTSPWEPLLFRPPWGSPPVGVGRPPCEARGFLPAPWGRTSGFGCV